MRKQAGVSIFTVVVTAAVLAAVASAFLVSGGSGAASTTTFKLKTILTRQAMLIRNKVRSCAEEFASGNNGQAKNKAFPYDATAWVSVTTLICPGNGLNLWAQADEILAPLPPAGFGNWLYYNDQATGNISLAISAPSQTESLSALVAAQADLNNAWLTTTSSVPDAIYGTNSRMEVRVK